MIPVADRVFPELWTSLAGLLKAYTAAHGLNSKLEAEIVNTAEVIEVKVLGRNRWLRLELRGSEGNWKREDGSGAKFSLLVNGNIVVEAGSEEEMDTIAEQLAREIMQ